MRSTSDFAKASSVAGLAGTVLLLGSPSCSLRSLDDYFEDTPANCGGCKLAHVSVTGCNAEGKCAPVKCDAGFDDCDGKPENGCEVDLTSDAVHCGKCLDACDTTNASPTCVAGKCQLACTAGYGDCDKSSDNGCEIDLLNDPKHCGACTTDCGTTKGCKNGKCCGNQGESCTSLDDCCGSLLCNGTCCISRVTC